jgi:type IV secretory pathway VirD2 relaxase
MCAKSCAGVERDLDTKLTWIAVNHHNTDNPHAHILLRGKQPDGADLVVPRQSVSYGIRNRASEVATELLGERTIEQAQEAWLKGSRSRAIHGAVHSLSGHARGQRSVRRVGLE